MYGQHATRLIICIGIAFLTLAYYLVFADRHSGPVETTPLYGDAAQNVQEDIAAHLTAVYDSLGIRQSICFEAFDEAIAGFGRIEGKRKNVLAVADFSKPSTAQRLVVIDMDNMDVLFVSHVAHGRNSGGNYAETFSNISGSHQSSLGFYLTDSTYEGGNGYSLLLNGLEKGINDKARERAIVMHGARYCDPETIAGAGRLGRSFGCPALPTAVSKPIIDAIKNGAVLFIYADCDEYKAQSPILGDRPGNLLAQLKP